MFKARPFIAAGLVLLVGLWPSRALPEATGESEPRTASPPTFGERVEVNVVNVDVVVTDRSGKLITGLGVEDFELYDEGARVEVSNFAAVSEPRLDGSATGVATGIAAAEPLQLIVLLDNVNTRPQNRAHMLGQLRSVLAGLGARDRVILVSYDKAIHVHQTWTSDPTAIAAGLARLESTPNYGLELDNELDVVWEFISYAIEGESGSGGCSGIIDQAVSRYTYTVTHRVLTTVEAIRDLLGSMAGVPGRKAMLYISDGLELRPGSHIVKRMAGICGDASASIRAESYDIGSGLQKLSSAANSARVTLYPLDAAGGRQAPQAVRRDGASQLDQRANLHDSLNFLAADTGGKALLNAIDLPTAMKPLWTDLGSFYSLGYEAPAAGSGDLRRLEVKVKRKGAQVRYRHGYLDRTPEERLNDQLLAALWVGEGSNTLGVRMEPAGEAVAMDGGRRVPLRIGIPLGNLTLQPGDTGYEGRFTLFVTSRDETGSRSAISSSVVPVQIPAGELEAAREQLFGYEIGLLMPEGRQRVAIGVRDDLSTVMSIITHEIEVGPRPERQP